MHAHPDEERNGKTYIVGRCDACGRDPVGR